MAIDWTKLVKPVTSAQTVAKAAPQARIAAGMDKALADFESGEVKERASIKKVGNDVVFSVRYGNQALNLIGENSKFAVPAAKFKDVYAAIKADVMAGKFDAQVNKIAADLEKRGQTMAKTRAANKAAKSK